VPRGLILVMMLVSAFCGVSWAQDKAQLPSSVLAGADITLQLSYSCPSGTACSFVCPQGGTIRPGRAGGLGAAGALGGAGGGGGGAAGAGGGAGGLGGPTEHFLGADHVTKLNIYLGTMPFGNGQNAPVLFYSFSTRERPNSSGFSISAGLSASSCQVNGLTLDHSGRPPSDPIQSPSPSTSQ
jgi:hypothetical protein